MFVMFVTFSKWACRSSLLSSIKESFYQFKVQSTIIKCLKWNDINAPNKIVNRKNRHTTLYILHDSNFEKILALKIYQNVKIVISWLV